MLHFLFPSQHLQHGEDPFQKRMSKKEMGEVGKELERKSINILADSALFRNQCLGMDGTVCFLAHLSQKLIAELIV